MPRAYLICEPVLVMDQVSSVLEDLNLDWKRTPSAAPAEELTEFAGRVCYLSFGTRQSPRTNASYIANLIGAGHESVLEHAVWTFVLTGISRACSHQLVRHRAGFAFSQLSQQYHAEMSAVFVRPPEIAPDSAAGLIWEASVEASRAAYLRLLELLGSTDGKDKEQRRSINSAARSVLPNATSTILVVSANARALRHFFAVRGSILGDVEMRAVAVAIWGCLARRAPSLFPDFSLQLIGDGTEGVVRHNEDIS